MIADRKAIGLSGRGKLSRTSLWGAMMLSSSISAFTASSGWSQNIPGQQSDISTSLCRAHMGLIDAVLEMRANGLPISTAEDAVQSTDEIDRRLYAVMLTTVRLAYSDPAQLQARLSNGQWLQNCASYVRGF